jgi:membrane protease subunit HflC
MRKYLLILLALVIVVVAARLSVFTVGPTEYVYVTMLGKHQQTLDGARADTDAGLHVSWPWPVVSVQRLDRRLQFLDLPAMELVTRDPESRREGDMLIVEGYVCWRIAGADSVDTFIRRRGTIQDAEADLGQKINSQLGGVIVQLSTRDLVNTDPAVVEQTMQRIREQVTGKLRAKFLDEYGVELVDVRLRRFSYSPQVRRDIFARIRSERDKKAQDYLSLGKQKADAIRSDAEEKARGLLADARKQEEILKGKADTEAAMIRNQAHSKDPNFYVFLKKLDNLQSILGDNKTVLLLSSHRVIFDMLFQPPPGAAAVKSGNGAVATKNGKGKTATVEKKDTTNGTNGVPSPPGGR